MPSFVLSSGEEEGGDGVVREQAARRRWSWMRRFISTFSVSGEGVESRDEIRIGEDGRDIVVVGAMWERWMDR